VRLTAPKIRISEPSKFVVIEIASRLSPATTVSAVASHRQRGPARRISASRINAPPPATERVELGRHHEKVEGQLAADRQHHDRQQDAQLFGLEVGAEPRADLRAHDAPTRSRTASTMSTV
jgi:hypothetical protein